MTTEKKSLRSLISAIEGQAKAPPLHLWHPELCGDIDIFIDKTGQWFHNGEVIQREALVKLFASILRREEDNEYYLVTPVEKWRIAVEEVPLIIIDIEVRSATAADQIIIVTTNVGTHFEISEDFPLEFSEDPETKTLKPYAYLENDLVAKFSRPSYYELINYAEQKNGFYILRSHDCEFILQRIE